MPFLRNCLWVLPLFASVVAGAVPGDSNASLARPAPPNVVLILADDLGWGDLGVQGHPEYRTPNLDRLAAEGVRFQQAYMPASVCSPSRAGVLTGRFPARSSLYNSALSLARQVNIKAGNADWLDPQAPSLARVLKQAGYHTVHLGKWHLTGEDGLAADAPTPAPYGFDRWETMRGPAEWTVSGMRRTLTQKAVDFIKKPHTQPFFLNLWIHEPHVPHDPSKESLALNASLDERARVYASVLSDMDRDVGRVLTALREAGLEQNTVVIFTSDNGPAPIRDDPNAPFGQYYDRGSTGGLRGHKGTFYEGGVRVPLLVRWPGQVPVGRVDTTTVVSAVDFLPTLAAAAGLAVPPGTAMDGENLLAAWRGQPVVRQTPLYWVDGKSGRRQVALRDGSWKFFVRENSAQVELFDVVADPAESRNLAAEQPAVVARLQPQIHAFLKTLPAEPDPRCLSRFRVAPAAKPLHP